MISVNLQKSKYWSLIWVSSFMMRWIFRHTVECFLCWLLFLIRTELTKRSFHIIYKIYFKRSVSVSITNVLRIKILTFYILAAQPSAILTNFSAWTHPNKIQNCIPCCKLNWLGKLWWTKIYSETKRWNFLFTHSYASLRSIRSKPDWTEMMLRNCFHGNKC